ncbi:MAG: PmoA family protein [Acidobacteriia bacterium]|nr:PmoA family protein [Terriglobia bacterium]
MDRRRWMERMAQGLAAVNAVGLARAVDYDKPPPGTEKLTAQQSEGLMLFRWNNRPIGVYRAHSSQKYPYFYPLAGPATGLSLVAESALPYPHHRGLWLGCQPMNGGDYWGDTTLDTGQIRSTRLQLGKQTPQSGVFTDACEWVRKAAPSPLDDARTFTINVVDNRLWWLDADLVLTAREDITIKSAKHSFFALRVSPQISPLYGGILANSEGGIGAEGTYGKPARWCGYHGKTAADVVEGLAVMDHPGNPWAPCPWFTRDYGHFSPSPFAFIKQPWTLPKGKSIRLRYRVVLHAGTPKQAGLDDVYRKWAA